MNKETDDSFSNPSLIGSINAPSPSEECQDKPKSRITRDRLGVVVCILMCELCERLTYYSVSGNLLLYCQNELNFSSPTATTVVLVFAGTSYFVPVFGGWLADSILGKYNTIYLSALIYCIGTTLLPVVSIHFGDYDSTLGLTNGQQTAFFMISLAIIAIGTGGIKSNVGPFGAQQLDDLGEDAVKSFFNWFYWFINVGSAVSFTLVVYVQQQYGFATGFAIPAVSIVLAIIILLIGRRKYRMRPPEGSVFTTVYKIISEAVSKINSPNPDHCKMTSFLDRSKLSFGGRFPDLKVDEVKSLGKILPIFVVIIFYWTVYAQMSTTYILQGERMRLVYGDFTVPVAALNLFDIIIILVLVPFIDRFLMPFLNKIGFPLSQLQRIGIGFIFAVVSMFIAAGIEFARKASIREYGYFQQHVGDKVYNASDLSVFAQIPQYTFIGTSEVFTSITGLEFAYSQSPKAMQGVVMGLFILTTGLGNYIGSLLVTIINAITAGDEWIPDEINYGHLEYYFFILAVIMGIDFIIFVVIAKRYVYVEEGLSELQPPADSQWESKGVTALVMDPGSSEA